jgi:DNA polymerase III subunit delta'
MQPNESTALLSPTETPIGVTEALQRLTNARDKGRLGHALLFAGGGGHGAYDLAIQLSRELLDMPRESSSSALWNHPDFKCLSPLPPASQQVTTDDGTDPVPHQLQRDPYARLEVGANWGIPADSARQMIQWASMTPWQASCKVALVAEVEKVNEATADIMLKTLEEPPDDVTIILVTARPQDLLPTVRSRCHETRIPPLEDDSLSTILIDRGADSGKVREVVKLAQGDLWQAEILLAGDANELRTEAADLISAALNPEMKVADVMQEARAVGDGLSSGDVSELIRWMIWWLRDAILTVTEVHEGSRELEPVMSAARKVGRERLTQWLEEADRAHEMLSRNVTPQAVLAALTLFPRDQLRLGTGPTFPPRELIVTR